MALDDYDEMLSKCIKHIKEERQQYFETLFEKYVVTDDNSGVIDMHTLTTIKAGSGSTKLSKPFGSVSKYKLGKGRAMVKQLKRTISVYRKVTAVRYETEEEEATSDEQSVLEISNILEQDSFSTPVKSCCVQLERIDLKKSEESPFKIHGLSEDTTIKLNYTTPKRNILKYSELNTEIDPLSLSFSSGTPKEIIVRKPELKTNIYCVKPEVSKSLAKSSSVFAKHPSSLMKMPVLRESPDISYSFKNKNGSAQCRSPVNVCSLSLRQLNIKKDLDDSDTDSSDDSESVVTNKLENDMKFCKITRHILCKSSENKVSQSRLHSKSSMGNLLKYNKEKSSVYPKTSKKIIDTITLEEYIEYEGYGDDVISNSTSIIPKSNSHSVIPCNTPSFKNSTPDKNNFLKPISCSPATPTLLSNIRLKSLKLSIKDK